MAFKGRRVYTFALIFLCLQFASATSNFFPSIVKTLGFSKVDTLLTVPPYMMATFVTIANNWSGDRHRNSSFHVVWHLILAIIGFIVGAASLKTGSLYFAIILMVTGGRGANAVVLAWTQKAMLRP